MSGVTAGKELSRLQNSVSKTVDSKWANLHMRKVWLISLHPDFVEQIILHLYILNSCLMKCCLPKTAHSNPWPPEDRNSSFPMHESKPQRKGRWSKCNLFNMACSLLSWRKKKKRRKPFSTDKSNYSHRTPLPGTKLFLVVKTVNKWWKWGWGDQWSFEVFSPCLK